MIIYPAIDLRGGKCVRLVQGDPEQETVFSDDPAAMAARWCEAGAQYLHVVDLDGAFGGVSAHLEVIAGMAAAVDAPIQVGGGLRSLEAIQAVLDAGASRAILGTAAVRDPELVQRACGRFPERIAVGIDARNGEVAIRGWQEVTEVAAADMVRRLAGLPLAALICTDITTDGMLTGPNLDFLARLAELATCPIIASGGVSSLDDVRALMQLEGRGVAGAIIGKALYTGAVDFAAALALTRQEAA